jgi:hypothetical protein
MCILPVSNQSIEESLDDIIPYSHQRAADLEAFAGSSSLKDADCARPLSMSSVFNAEEENWFCPLHTCVGCGALQLTACTMQTLRPPPSMQTLQVAGSARIPSQECLVRKPLTLCSTCPTALCKTCESDLGLGRPLMRSRRSDFSTKPHVRCINCTSNDPHLALAKLLEAAWFRMARSRLALPFLHARHPLLSVKSNFLLSDQLALVFRSLPIMTEQVIRTAFISSTLCDNSESTLSCHGLLDLLSHIRSFKFSSVGQFILVLARLGSHVLASFDEEANSNATGLIASNSLSILSSAFATISSTGLNYLSLHRTEAQFAQTRILEIECEKKVGEGCFPMTLNVEESTESLVHISGDGALRYESDRSSDSPDLRSLAEEEAVLIKVTVDRSSQKVHAPHNILESNIQQQETDEVKNDPKGRDTFAVEKFLCMWRVSCETRFLGGYSTASAKLHLEEKLTVRDRSLDEWAVFLKRGASSSSTGSRSATLQVMDKLDEEGRCKVARLLADQTTIEDQLPVGVAAASMLQLGHENIVLNHDVNDDGHCIEETAWGPIGDDDDDPTEKFFMDPMSSNRGETITLNETGPRALHHTCLPLNRPTSGSSNNDEFMLGEWGCPRELHEDETMGVFDRLNDLTSRIMSLQMRLRREHLSKQRSLSAQAPLDPREIVSLGGNNHALQELQFSNRDLRWRLKQKQKTLNTQNTMVLELNSTVASLTDKLQQKNAALASAEVEIKRLTRVLNTLNGAK